MKVYFAADHAGLDLKNALLAYVRDELRYEVEDCGAFLSDPNDDYPPIIARAAQNLSADVASGVDSRAVVLGGSGQGEAIVANRFKGVRAVVYYGKEPSIVGLSREHNDGNALSLGARFLATDEAKAALKGWLEASFPGEERHARRIRQIDDLGQAV